MGASIYADAALPHDARVQSTLPSRTPTRFLIVDDHAGFRRSLRAFLPGPDAQVSECSNGREALERYAAEQPDWVLMDIEMAGLDGLSATRLLKQRFPAARVIIVTNYNDPDLRAVAREAGACAFVLKEDLSHLQQLITDSKPTD